MATSPGSYSSPVAQSRSAHRARHDFPQPIGSHATSRGTTATSPEARTRGQTGGSELRSEPFGPLHGSSLGGPGAARRRAAPVCNGTESASCWSFVGHPGTARQWTAVGGGEDLRKPPPLLLWPAHHAGDLCSVSSSPHPTPGGAQGISSGGIGPHCGAGPHAGSQDLAPQAVPAGGTQRQPGTRSGDRAAAHPRTWPRVRLPLRRWSCSRLSWQTHDPQSLCHSSATGRPATTDYWVNDKRGDPLFVVTAEANAAL